MSEEEIASSSPSGQEMGSERSNRITWPGLRAESGPLSSHHTTETFPILTTKWTCPNSAMGMGAVHTPMSKRVGLGVVPVTWDRGQDSASSYRYSLSPH